MRKLNAFFAGSAGTIGALIGAPVGILAASALAASTFASAKDGREAIIAFFVSISWASCLNITMLSPSGVFFTSFFTGVGAGAMKAFAMAGGAVG